MPPVKHTARAKGVKASENGGGQVAPVVHEPGEVLVKVTIDRESLLSLLKALRQGTSTQSIKILPTEETHATAQSEGIVDFDKFMRKIII